MFPFRAVCAAEDVQEVAADDSCPMLKYVPRVEKTGNSWEDAERELQRTQLLKTMELLWVNPRVRGAVLVATEEAVASYGDAERSKAGTHLRAESFGGTFGAVDEEYMVTFVTKWTRITGEAIAKACKYDSESLKFTFCFMNNSTPNASMPAEAQSIEVLDKVLGDNVVAQGNMLADDITAEGRIKWETIGPYRFLSAGGDEPGMLKGVRFVRNGHEAMFEGGVSKKSELEHGGTPAVRRWSAGAARSASTQPSTARKARRNPR